MVTQNLYFYLIDLGHLLTPDGNDDVAIAVNAGVIIRQHNGCRVIALDDGRPGNLVSREQLSTVIDTGVMKITIVLEIHRASCLNRMGAIRRGKLVRHRRPFWHKRNSGNTKVHNFKHSFGVAPPVETLVSRIKQLFNFFKRQILNLPRDCLLYTSPSPRD